MQPDCCKWTMQLPLDLWFGVLLFLVVRCSAGFACAFLTVGLLADPATSYFFPWARGRPEYPKRIPNTLGRPLKIHSSKALVMTFSPMARFVSRRPMRSCHRVILLILIASCIQANCEVIRFLSNVSEAGSLRCFGLLVVQIPGDRHE